MSALLVYMNVYICIQVYINKTVYLISTVFIMFFSLQLNYEHFFMSWNNFPQPTANLNFRRLNPSWNANSTNRFINGLVSDTILKIFFRI